MYSILAKLLALGFAVISHDITIAARTKDQTIAFTFKIIANLITFSSVMLGAVLIPFIIPSIIFNHIDAFYIKKMKREY